MKSVRAADAVVLHVLARTPATRRAIAQETGMSEGYLHVVIARMESIGLVRRVGRVPMPGMGKGGTPLLWEIAS
jgi:DNA-binding MarR family transcriptional regulator